MSPPRSDYGKFPIGTADVSEGTLVKCAYMGCDGLVEIDYVHEVAEGFYCEGTCQSCGLRVDYDYKPQVRS